MNYNTFKPTYLASKRPHKTSEEVIQVCIMKPTLMRRLVVLNEQLVETKKGKKIYLLEDKNENPFYEDMIKANITQKMVTEATDFINFCADEEQKVIDAREKARKEALSDWY